MVGYKQTDIGRIPVDWETKKLGTVGIFKKGKGIRKDEVESYGIPCVRYGELYTHHNEYVKTFNSYINSDTAKNSQFIQKNDILFAGSGETKEEIGKCAAIIDEIEAYAGGDVIILSPFDCNSLFLGFLLNSQTIARQKAKQAQGDAVVHIYPSNLSNIQIPLPPLPEQEAIAEVLSNTDELITALEKRIAKKRLIKQGAMQTLLTPKDDWEVKKLGEVCDIKKGQLITSDTKVEGVIPVIAGGKKPAYFHNKSNRNGKQITVSGSGANAGFVSFHNYPIFASDCSTIGESKKYKIEYIYYLLMLFQEDIYNRQTGGAQPHIHPSDISPIEIPFPPIQEQTHIATILSDMDNEIDALEKKLSKTKELKQGLMQQLLTGKIRLV